MGWIGMLVGSYLGGSVGKLPGAIVGALLGHRAEEHFRRRRRSAERPHEAHREAAPVAPDLALAEAYALLGARADDSAAVLRRKYRELAKRNHPDALRAQGLSGEALARATERMSRLNAAWAAIRAARGL
ncbi:MAG: DnaJ family molecular chaperone [Kiritimatiellia bacterium]